MTIGINDTNTATVKSLEQCASESRAKINSAGAAAAKLLSQKNSNQVTITNGDKE